MFCNRLLLLISVRNLSDLTSIPCFTSKGRGYRIFCSEEIWSKTFSNKPNLTGRLTLILRNSLQIPSLHIHIFNVGSFSGINPVWDRIQRVSWRIRTERNHEGLCSISLKYSLGRTDILIDLGNFNGFRKNVCFLSINLFFLLFLLDEKWYGNVIRWFIILMQRSVSSSRTEYENKELKNCGFLVVDLAVRYYLGIC